MGGGAEGSVHTPSTPVANICTVRSNRQRVPNYNGNNCFGIDLSASPSVMAERLHLNAIFIILQQTAVRPTPNPPPPENWELVPFDFMDQGVSMQPALAC